MSYVDVSRRSSEDYARRLASERGLSRVGISEIVDSIRAHLSERPNLSYLTECRRGFWGWLSANVTSFMIITTILTIAFGILGFLPILSSGAGAEIKGMSTSFLEISKIFAGALVGGAAGLASANVRK